MLLDFILSYWSFAFSDEVLDSSFYESFDEFIELIVYLSTLSKSEGKDFDKYCPKITEILNLCFGLCVMRATEQNNYWTQLGVKASSLLSLVLPHSNDTETINSLVHYIVNFILLVMSLEQNTKDKKIELLNIPNYVDNDEFLKSNLLNTFSIINSTLFDLEELDKSLSNNFITPSSCNPLLLKKSENIYSFLLNMSSAVASFPLLMDYFILAFIEMQQRSNSALLLFFSITFFVMNSKISCNSINECTDRWDLLLQIDVMNEDNEFEIKDFRQMSEAIAIMAFFNSQQEQPPKGLFQQLNFLLLSFKPVACYNTINLLKQLLLANEDKFYKGFSSAGMLDTVLHAEKYFKYHLMRIKQNDMMMKIRSAIVSFVSMIVKRHSLFRTELYSQCLINYSLSLLAEHTTLKIGGDFLSTIIKFAPQPNVFNRISDVIKDCYSHISEASWKEIVFEITESIISALPYAYEKIVTLFVNTKCYRSFCTFPFLSSFLTSSPSNSSILSWLLTSGDNNDSDDNSSSTSFYHSSSCGTFMKPLSDQEKAIYMELGHNCLKLFNAMTQSSPLMRQTLESTSSGFVRIFSSFFKHIEPDEEMINLLIYYLTKDEKTMDEGASVQFKNRNGIILLFEAAANSPKYKDRILQFFIDATENSAFNRYQCSDVNLIDFLLTFVSHTSNEKSIQLIELIGTYYIKMNEFSHLLRLLKSSKKDYALNLIKSLSEMIKSIDRTVPVSFFHFTNDSTSFMIEDLVLSTPFSFSTKIELEPDSYKNEERTINLIKLSESNEQLILSIKDRRLILLIANSNEGFREFDLNITLNPNEWKQITVEINPQQIVVYETRNMTVRKLSTEFTSSSTVVKQVKMIPNHINASFHQNSSERMIFQISQVSGNFESITFYDKNSTKLAEFSAKFISQSTCLNLIKNSSSFPCNATFNGLSVTDSLTIIDILPSCGGPKILLPLFSFISQSQDPSSFFKYLMTIIQQICDEKEVLFKNQFFFKNLGQFLLQIDPNLLNHDIFVILLHIFKQMTDDELKQEIITYIWTRSDIYKYLESDCKDFIFNGVFPAIINEPIFRNTVKFSDLFILFYMILNNSEDKALIIKSWDILRLSRKYSFSSTDLDLLIGVSFDLTLNPFNNICAQEIISFLIKDNSPLLKDLIETHKTDLFIPYLHSPDIKIRARGLQLVNLLSKKIKISSDDIIKMIQYQTTVGHTRKMNDFVLSLLLGKVGNHMVTFNEEYNFDIQTCTIVNPIYLPLFACLLQFISDDESVYYSNLLMDILITSEESRKQIASTDHWPFWLVFISSFDWNSQKWQKCLGLILKEVQFEEKLFRANLNEIVTLMIITQEKPSQQIKAILSFVIENDPSEYSILASIIHLFYTIEVETEGYTKFQKNLTEYAKWFVTNQKHKMIKMTLNPQICNEVEYKLAISVIIQCIDSMKEKYCRFIPNLTYSYLASFLLNIMSKFDENKCLVFVSMFIETFKSCQNSLFNPFNLLENTLSDKDICQQIKKLDIQFQQNPQTKMYSFEQVLNMLKDKENDLSAEITSEINTSTIVSLERQLNILFNPSHITHITSKFVNFFHKEMEETHQKVNRSIKRNERFLKNTLDELHGMNGGAWSSNEQLLHFKMSTETDDFGRPIFMKHNFAFNDHRDASEMRDSGHETILKQRASSLANFDNGSETSDDEEYEKDGPTDQIRVISTTYHCKMITVQMFYEGKLYLYNDSLEYESSETLDSVGEIITKETKIVRIMKKDVTLILKRRYIHVERACEIFYDRNSALIVFDDTQKLEKFLSEIQILRFPNLRGIAAKNKTNAKLFKELGFEKQWHQGDISNYEYLYWVNMFSGRSFHDLSQYPIFPWIISNYSDNTFDVNDPKNYRDLSQPIGALNKERLERLMESYKEMIDTEFACLYRFHYSTAAYVISYLIRCEPFTSLHIELQAGRFDLANRLFLSIPSAWKSVNSMSSDFRELIPEFFCNPEFLMNTDNFDLGFRDDTNELVNDVTLPNWAKTASDFVAINRLALESNFVSQNINKWIDLIFGYKQSGEAALEANNLFHPYSYSSCIAKISDESELTTIEHHAMNFGIIPEQLFSSPHQQRQWQMPNTRLENSDLAHYKINLTKVDTKEKSFSLFANRSTLWSLSQHSVTTFTVVHGDVCQHHSDAVSLDFPERLATPELLAYRSQLLPHNGNVVISLPWNQGFDVFPFTRKGKRHTSAKLHSTFIGILSADEKTIVTGARDSSIVVWDTDTFESRTFIVTHTAQISALSVCDAMNLIVSCDSTGMLVFSTADTGSFIRCTYLTEQSTFLHISNLGFVVSVANIDDDASKNTVITVIDFGGRIVQELTFNETICTACHIINLRDAASFIVLAFSDHTILVIDVIYMKIVAELSVNDEIISIAFVEDSMTLCCASKEGNLYTAKLLC